MEFSSEKFIAPIKSFWLKYEPKIVLGIGLFLIAVISFEFGLIQGKKGQETPLVIEKFTQSEAGPIASQIADAQATSASTPQAQNPAQEAEVAATSSTILPANCAFVGSKNSDKFHVPTCSFAKRILPKNLVCFKSAEEALAQGRVGDKGCIR